MAAPNPCGCGCGGHPANYYAKFIAGHRPKGDPVQRFWSKVNKDCPSGCWVWIGAIGSHGYGTFWTGERFMLAHRYSLSLTGHADDPDQQVDHLCRNRPCVRPDHLEYVAPIVNVRRALPFRPRATHCSHGHDFAETGFTNSSGYRDCRTCSRTRNLAAYHRKKTR